MSVGDKLNEAFCWLKEEFDGLINDLELDKSELNVSEICTKMNNTIRSINGTEKLDLNGEDKEGGGYHKIKEHIDSNKLIGWNDLNYSVFHYIRMYNKIHEKLLIEDDEFFFNFDAENFYVKRKFTPSLTFHPLIYAIDVAYFNFLLYFISGGTCDKTVEPYITVPYVQNSHNSIKYSNRDRASSLSSLETDTTDIVYVYSDDQQYKQNFQISEEAYEALSRVYTKVSSINRYVDQEGEALFNFGSTREERQEVEKQEVEKQEVERQGVERRGVKKNTDGNLNEAYAFSLRHKVYMIHEKVNEKIKVYNGDISQVDSHAIVLFANHNYKYSKNVCDDLYSSTLMKLEEEDRLEIKSKKSGEVYLTNSYDNIHKYILHVMLPKYNSKYILATHNTMNLCVQEILYTCFDKKIHSISVPIISFNLFFPINIFLITFLKSLRSLLLLPQFYNNIRSVILVTNTNHLYMLLLKYVSIFFPRCNEEMYLSANIAILGNKYGSIDVQNRGIRIFKTLRRVGRGARVERKRNSNKSRGRMKGRPKNNVTNDELEKQINDDTSTRPNHADRTDEKSCIGRTTKTRDNSYHEKSLRGRKGETMEYGSDEMCIRPAMCEYPVDLVSSSLEEARNLHVQRSSPPSPSSSPLSSPSSSSSSSDIFKEADREFLNLKTESESHKKLYCLREINKNEENMMMNLEWCLRLSYMYDKKKKFNEFKNGLFMYEYGSDELGRNTVVINFFNFPVNYNYHLLFFYLLFYFNTFMRNHFVLLFIFSENISTQITNVLSLFKDIFQVIQKFLKNLKIIYFFNYSLAFKLFIYILYPFIPSSIYENIIYLNDVTEMSKYFDVKKVLKK
ncbi:hypothetical protein, conserved [Plasmodium gonderi]|uniref:Macro domain-containing protein n=1 Tax=Plasmodium gonderi TaxID=77519 RepID=A0A1Y1J9X5_PLAGO|nr:hypothetical protein, conserved [Plasmodium gonderi]GAW79311.1 hypothetical protein, conserved [Plasmodium gonderi]